MHISPSSTSGMTRRQCHRWGGGAIGALLLGAWQQAQALSLGQLSQADASNGVKLALNQGAQAAVALLGRPDGFLGNPAVRIPLSGYLENAARLLKSFGQGQRITELEKSINRAAEAAVPMGRDLLVNAVQTMSLGDARKILAGGDNAVTAFFAEKTRAPLGTRFLPVVKKSIEQVGLAQQYSQFAGRAAALGLVSAQDADLPQYVTGKTLDGLFLMIGEEERKIRRDPVGTGSVLLQKVFGAR